jgi:catechol 2,3-dioxygenase-like lactoylglutathione lyase family enzyme
MLRLAHVNLSIHDLDEAVRFYADVLQLERAPKPAEAGRRPGAWFRLGAVELHLSLEVDADNAASQRHVAFEVDALDTWRARLTAAGCALDDSRPVPGMRRFFVRDPSGNRLEFFEPA